MPVDERRPRDGLLQSAKTRSWLPFIMSHSTWPPHTINEERHVTVNGLPLWSAKEVLALSSASFAAFPKRIDCSTSGSYWYMAHRSLDKALRKTGEVLVQLLQRRAGARGKPRSSLPIRRTEPHA